MGEIISSIYYYSVLELFVVFGGAFFLVFFIVRSLLRRAFVNNFDPLHVQVVLFFCPYFTGYLVVPFLFSGVSVSFFIILFFVFCFLFLIWLIGKPKVVGLRDKMRPEFQFLLLCSALVILLLHVFFNMIAPGNIPLFSESGVHGRFESTQNSRLLAWLWFATGSVGGLVFALSENIKVIKFSMVVLLLQMVSGILFASKGSVVQLFFVLLLAMFFAKARGNVVRFNFLKKGFIVFVFSAFFIVPVYFSFIGFGKDDSGVLLGLGIRVFGGFDQLIPAAIMDMVNFYEPVSLIGSDVFSYQLMPFFKSILSVGFDYDNIGQYVLFEVLGRRIEGAFTFPNSNLVLEVIFTSGFFFGFFVFVFELGLFYFFRYMALKRQVDPLGFFLTAVFVAKPIGLFMSGQEWVTNSIVLGCLVFFCWLVSEVFVLASRKNGRARGFLSNK